MVCLVDTAGADCPDQIMTRCSTSNSGRPFQTAGFPQRETTNFDPASFSFASPSQSFGMSTCPGIDIDVDVDRMNTVVDTDRRGDLSRCRIGIGCVALVSERRASEMTRSRRRERYGHSVLRPGFARDRAPEGIRLAMRLPVSAIYPR